MKWFYKILFAAAILNAVLIFASCKPGSQSKVFKNVAAPVSTTDTALQQFMHFFADTLPLPVNYVNDYENLFSPAQETYLNSLLDSFETKTTTQVAIVTIDQIMVSNQDFDSLTMQLANAWRVGDKNKNNGILVGICAGYKKLRIQNGEGIRKILSDAETKQIVDSSFIPYYKNVDYFTGTENGVRAIIKKLSSH
jgi:uncharacterized protein